MRKTVILLVTVLAFAAMGLAQGNQRTSTNPGNIWVVAGPVPQNVTDTSATLWWETNKPGPTTVKYGTDQNNLSQQAQQPYGETSHSVQLANLQPNTTYFWEIDDNTGAKIMGGEFHTQASGYQQSQTVRITNGPNIEYVGPDSATVAWTTNVPSGAVVKFGTDSTNMTQTAQAPWGGTTHRVTLTGLHPGETVYFQVQSAQGQNTGTAAQSEVARFLTPANAQQALHPMQQH